MSPRSYASPKRDAAGARTRQRLVRAAAKILKSPRGPLLLSLESVARAAEVSRATVYNQFGSRRGLLEAVFDDWALRGGVYRIAEAMADPSPHAGLDRLIEVFCAFWDFDRKTFAGLLGAAAADKDLRESLQERQERGRRALRVLVSRLELRRPAAADLVDALYAITSFQVFAELAQRGRDTAATCQLMKKLATAAVATCSSLPPDAPEIDPRSN
jgi:AcrR family transcriptional regulator